MIDAFDPPQPYVISGTGPYLIPFPYATGAVQAWVLTPGGDQIALDPGADFGAVPAETDTTGDLHLTMEAASLHAGAQLYITRATVLEQGWQGQGAREVGLQRQLDLMTMAGQEAGRAAAGAVRTLAPIPPFIPAGTDTVLLWDGQRVISGPEAAQIAAAEAFAQAAEAARDKAQDWAEGSDPPGDPGTKSARDWAEDAQIVANTILSTMTVTVSMLAPGSTATATWDRPTTTLALNLPKGDTGSPGAGAANTVRYDEPQALTGPQMQQVRENIGAWPIQSNGAIQPYPGGDLDVMTVQSGIYIYQSATMTGGPSGPQWGTIIHTKRTGSIGGVIQILAVEFPNNQVGDLWVRSGTQTIWRKLARADDPRLTDAREWNVPTVSEVDAKAGVSTDRKAWSALRVRQAALAAARTVALGEDQDWQPVNRVVGTAYQNTTGRSIQLGWRGWGGDRTFQMSDDGTNWDSIALLSPTAPIWAVIPAGKYYRLTGGTESVVFSWEFF